MRDEKLEVIAAFVDGERVDAEALKLALSDAAGRDYLADIVSLREAARAPEAAAPLVASTPPRPWRWLAAAAVISVSVGSGFFIGQRLARTNATTTASAVPAPNRVIELKPGVNWHETGGGH